MELRRFLLVQRFGSRWDEDSVGVCVRGFGTDKLTLCCSFTLGASLKNTFRVLIWKLDIQHRGLCISNLDHNWFICHLLVCIKREISGTHHKTAYSFLFDTAISKRNGKGVQILSFFCW